MISLCLSVLRVWHCFCTDHEAEHVFPAWMSGSTKIRGAHRHGCSPSLSVMSKPWVLLNSDGSALLLDWSSLWWISHLIYCWACSISGKDTTPGLRWRSRSCSLDLCAHRFSATLGLGMILMARRRRKWVCSICYTWASSPGKCY